MFLLKKLTRLRLVLMSPHGMAKDIIWKKEKMKQLIIINQYKNDKFRLCNKRRHKRT